VGETSGSADQANLEPARVHTVVTIETVGAARDAIRSVATGEGLGQRVAEDLVIAASEILNNAIRHGGGRGMLTVQRLAATVIVEVSDSGPGMAADPPTQFPPADVPGGRGIVMARMLCPDLEITNTPNGVTVRLAVPTRRP